MRSKKSLGVDLEEILNLLGFKERKEIVVVLWVMWKTCVKFASFPSDCVACGKQSTALFAVGWFPQDAHERHYPQNVLNN